MRIKAIILKKQATNDWDQLVTMYSEDFGVVRAVGQMAQR